MELALAIDGARFDHDLAGLAAMRAAVHAQRPPDAAGYAAIETEAGDAGVRRSTGHLHVGHRRAGAEAMAFLNLNVTEPSPKANDHALDAAVAHQ